MTKSIWEPDYIDDGYGMFLIGPGPVIEQSKRLKGGY